MIAFDHRQSGFRVQRHHHIPPRHLRFSHRHRLLQDVGEIGPLHLQPDRPHELQHLDDDRVGELRLAQDVGEQRLRVLRVGHLAAEQSRHHFDPGERVLQLVRDAGGHFTERRQPIAQPLLLLDLLDAREVLEEHHGADGCAAVVLHLRQRVADHAIDVLQPKLDAVRQMAQFERARQHPDDVRPRAQHILERPPDIRVFSRQRENAIRLIVHERQRSVAPDRNDAVSHAADDVSKKPIVRQTAAPDAGPFHRRRSRETVGTRVR